MLLIFYSRSTRLLLNAFTLTTKNYLMIPMIYTIFDLTLYPAMNYERELNRYRVNFWADIVSEDSTSEIMNVFAMILSMVGILLKYKTCAWFGLLVAAVSYANVRSNYDGKQIMSTFMLSMSSVVMCYLTNPQPISVYFNQVQQQQASTGQAGGLGQPPASVAQ